MHRPEKSSSSSDSSPFSSVRLLKLGAIFVAYENRDHLYLQKVNAQGVCLLSGCFMYGAHKKFVELSIGTIALKYL